MSRASTPWSRRRSTNRLARGSSPPGGFTVGTRIASESFPMAVPPEEAERRCRRALMEAWVGRETAAFRLPPSRLALDPADAIRLAHDGRLVDLRLVSIADAEARAIETVRQDRDDFAALFHHGAAESVTWPDR